MFEELKALFEQFKQANDERLKQIEAKGHADPILNEKVDKINAAITETDAKIKARCDELEAKLNRMAVSAGNGGVDPIIAEHSGAFMNFVRRNQTNGLDALEVKALLTTQSDPDGGYMVPQEIETSIDRILALNSVMRQIATVRAVGAQEYKKFINVGGAGAGWVGEEDTRTETATPTLKELGFTNGTLYAFPFTTQDLLDDASFGVESWLSDEVGIAMAEMEGAALINGNGVKKPRGVLNYDKIANANYAWGKLGYIAGGKTTTLEDTDKLIDLIHSLKAGYRQNAAFLMNSLSVAALRKLKNGDGDYIWQPGLTAGAPSVLLGHAVKEDDNMPDIGAGTYPIAFGDFKRGYVITDRMGVRVLRDPYTVKGKIGFYATKRVGGGIQNFEALKLLKIHTS